VSVCDKNVVKLQDIDDYFHKARDAANNYAASIQQSSNVSITFGFTSDVFGHI